jgi:uncharacterized membrane protein
MSQFKKKLVAAFVAIVNIVCAYSLYDTAYGEYADQSVVAEILSFEKMSFVNCIILIDVVLLIVLAVWKFLHSKTSK